ncbi:hypothetical protein AB1303_13875 [Saccharolobus solfataricus]|uniref:Uncharacterized protein n=2 Tax=Saccharolobus solfataricus TaxID=2287 RepID=Q97ZP1_SACS2|nr:hypothetical protein [Saccharolobus solfataricus]AAK41137.1 Hypothetical protein SSO6661 [Saccharolobus solfataricus P2]QPG49179.1 hypothetical protein HFC64_04250 [Saccharolobus solfataricus]SAI84442.1 uncharacterised protein [Saccharolobus solfataricus]
MLINYDITLLVAFSSANCVPLVSFKPNVANADIIPHNAKNVITIQEFAKYCEGSPSRPTSSIGIKPPSTAAANCIP